MSTTRCVPALVILVAACARPTHADSAAVTASTTRAPRFDSATVARLCANRDSARAVDSGCLLRDQGMPPPPQPRVP